MPEAGGPTTWSGLSFQARVVVRNIAIMMCDTATDERSPIVSVRAEAPEFVDDIVITRFNGERVFQTIKERVERSSFPVSPWAKMWRSIQDQQKKEGFDPVRDKIEIVLSIETDQSQILNRLGQTVRSALNFDEVPQRLSERALHLLNHLSQLLSISDSDTAKLLRSVQISYTGDAELLDQEILARLALAYPADHARVNALAGFLKSLVLDGASTRTEFNWSFLERKFAEGGFQFAFTVVRNLFVVKDISGEANTEDVRRFFRGFGATWQLIKDSVPVERIAYSSRKAAILDKAKASKRKGGLQVYFLTGARGTGKTTLAKTIAYDLGVNGHLSVWVNTYHRQLNSSLVAGCKILLKSERLHLFASLEQSSSERTLSTGEHLLSNIADFLKPFGGNPMLTLYLTIDSNHYSTIDGELSDVLPSKEEVISLPLNLDANPESELDALVMKLRQWDALGRLSPLDNGDVRRVFERKARKILMVALIEATQGLDERDGFQNILKREYKALPEQFQNHYALVALLHSYQIAIPLSLFASTAGKLLGSAGFLSMEHFRSELRHVLFINGEERVLTRHPRVAETLCEALTTGDDGFWVPYVNRFLESIDTEDESHVACLREFSASKVVGILAASLPELVENIARGNHGPFPMLCPEHRSWLLTSVARTFQGRSHIPQAIACASRAKKIWPSSTNLAEVVLAYCFLAVRDTVSAIALGEQMVSEKQTPDKLLTGIKILLKGGEVNRAEVLLENNKEKLIQLPELINVKRDILRAKVRYEDDQSEQSSVAEANWIRSRLEFGQIDSDIAIVRLQSILQKDPNVNRAFADLCHLLLSKKRVTDVIAVCDHLLGLPCRQKANESLSGTTETTQSMAIATKAWALFKNTESFSTSEVRALFDESLSLYPKNYWACNWKGLFLDTIEPGSDDAEQELRKAIRLNKTKPPFFYNLAKLLLNRNTNPFSKARNREILQLCECGLDICSPDSYWNVDGLREKLMGLRYEAESLERQHINDSIFLT